VGTPDAGGEALGTTVIFSSDMEEPGLSGFLVAV
jgi:hypothetical protein